MYKKTIDTGGNSGDTQATEDELETRMKDPKNTFGSPEYDEKFAEATLAMKKEVWGNK